MTSAPVAPFFFACQVKLGATREAKPSRVRFLDDEGNAFAPRDFLPEEDRKAAEERASQRMREWHERNPAYQPSRFSQWMKKTGEGIQEGVSPAMTQALKDSEIDGDILSPSTWSLGKNPSAMGLAGHVAKVGGEMAPIMAAGAVPVVGPGLATLAASGQAAAGAYEESHDYVTRAKQEELEKSREYQNLMGIGLSDEEARKVLADTAGRAAMGPAAAIGGLSGMILSGAATAPMQRAITNRMGNTFRARMLGNAAEMPLEGAQEVAESVAGRYAANQAADLKRDLTEGTFADAMLGAAAAGPAAVAHSLNPGEQNKPSTAPGLQAAMEEARRRMIEGDSAQNSTAITPQPLREGDDILGGQNIIEALRHSNSNTAAQAPQHHDGMSEADVNAMLDGLFEPEEAQGGWRSDLGSVDIPDDVRSGLAGRYEAAERIMPEFESSMGEIADSVGGRAIVAPLKGADRAASKVMGDYQGDASRITDLVRGTIEIPDVSSAADILSQLRERYGEPIKEKNTLDPSQPPPFANGYRDINSVWMIDGEPVEVQVNVPEMLIAKKQAHPLYVERAELTRSIEAEGRDPTADELSEIARLDAEQAAIYLPAWEAAMRRMNSSSEMKSASASNRVLDARTGLPDAQLNVRAGLYDQGSPSTNPNFESGGSAGEASFISNTSAPSVPREDSQGRATFPPESGTLGIPRTHMPQIKGEHRDAFLQFLGEHGIASQPGQVDPAALKPTQADYSPEAVERFAKTGPIGERSVLVSSDGYVLDGHHQWMAMRSLGKPVDVIHLDASIRELLAATDAFPHTQRSDKVRAAETAEPGQDAPTTMQNRDRSRVASVAQMQSIRKNPDPERLGFSRDPNTGAPMVGEGIAIPDADKGRADTVVMASGRRVPVQYAVVEAVSLAASHDADGRVNPHYETAPLKALNNGRVAGLQAAWQAGNAEAYREGIVADAALHGVSAEAIASKENPVLVRLYNPAMNTGDMGAESNASAQLGLSPVEQAQTDARALPDMAGIQWGEDGTLNPAQNADFFRAFFKNIGATQAATLQDAEGQPNVLALQRVRAAMVQRAYGDERLLTALVEDANPDNRNIVNALVRSAAGFAQLDQNHALSHDLRALVTNALETVRDASRRGLSVAEAVAQGDLLGRDANTDTVAVFMAENARSPKKMAAAFNAMAEYADTAQKQDSVDDIFGTAPAPSVERAIAEANKALREAYGNDTKTIPSRAAAPAESGRGESQRNGQRGSPAEASGDPESGFTLTRQSTQPAPAAEVSTSQGGLFGAPTAADYLDAHRRAKDNARNGRNSTGRTDMLAGEGELFAGPRPEQGDIEGAAQSEPLTPEQKLSLEALSWPTRNAQAAEAYKKAKRELDAIESRIEQARSEAYSSLPDGYYTKPHGEDGKWVALYDQDDNLIFYPGTPEEASARAWEDAGNPNGRFEKANAIERELLPEWERLNANLKAAAEAWDLVGKHPRSEQWEAEEKARAEAERARQVAAAKAAATRRKQREERAKKKKASAGVDPVGAAQSEPKRSSKNESARRYENGIPQGLPASETEDSRRLEQIIDVDNERNGEPTGFKALAVEHEGKLPDALRSALAAFERATGTRVVIFRNLTPEIAAFNGVTVRDGVLFIDEKSEHPLTSTAAHEWVHNLRKSDPELYRILAREVIRQGDAYGFAAKYGYSRESAVEELTAAAVGDALTDPVFLQRMAERNRSVFRRVAEAFLEFLNTLTNGWRNQNSNAYLRDVEAFRDKLAEVLDAMPPGRPTRQSTINAAFQRVFGGSPKAAKIEPMHSRKAETKTAYEQRIDELFAGGKPNYKGVRILDRADMLDLLGHGDKPLHLVESAVRKRDAEGRIKHPGMTLGMWKRLPEWIENPVAVFNSQTVPGALVMIGPELVAGRPVRITLEPNEGMAGLDVHVLTNAYEEGGSHITPVGKWVAKGDLLYLDQKVSPAFSERSGLRLPGEVRQLRGYRHRVQTEADLGKYRAERDAMFSRKTEGPTPEARAEAKRQFKDTERAYGGREAYDKAKAAGRTSLTYGQWVQVRTPNFKRFFGDWEAVRARDALQKMEAISATFPSAFDSNFSKAKEAARAEFDKLRDATDKHGYGAIASDGRKIKFSGRGFKEASQHAADRRVLAVVANLGKLFESAVPLYSEQPSDQRQQVSAFHYYGVKAGFGNAGEAFALLEVIERSNGDFFYDADATSLEEIRAASHAPLASQTKTGAGGGNAAHVGRLARWWNGVNPADVSKVVDPATGEPMVVYHGTDEDFDAFNQQIGGIYLAEKHDVSEAYSLGADGTIHGAQAFFANAKNMLDVARGDGIDVLQQVEREYDNGTDYRDPDDGEYMPLADWVTSGYLFKLGRDAQNEVMESLRSEGFDAVRYKDAAAFADDAISLVVFNPTQIKSATGNIGTFDDSFGEIMFSRKTNDVRDLSPDQIELLRSLGLVNNEQADLLEKGSEDAEARAAARRVLRDIAPSMSKREIDEKLAALAKVKARLKDLNTAVTVPDIDGEMTPELRGRITRLGYFLQGYVKDNPDAFSYGHSQPGEKDIQKIAKEMVPDNNYTFTKERTDAGGVEHWTIKTNSGHAGNFELEPGGVLQLHIGGLMKGSTDGSQLYAIFNTWAARNGYQALPDRAGLSEVNKYRRTPNMLSNALREGTTHHLMPHPDQHLPHWSKGRGPNTTAFNIGYMALREAKRVLDPRTDRLRIHLLDKVRYDFDKHHFVDSKGRGISVGEYDSILSQRAAGQGAVGRRSAQRASFVAGSFHEMRRRGITTTREAHVWGASVAHASAESRLRADADSEGHAEGDSDPLVLSQPFYSRRQQDTQAPPPGGVSASGAGETGGWEAPQSSAFDSFLYYMQDKQIDLRRVIQSIKATGKKLGDLHDAYLREELFHGRAAKRTQDFITNEFEPLLRAMHQAGVSMEAFEEYLHNRHAEEANAQVAKVNPKMPDGGSGITTQEARAYLAGLSASKRKAFEALAARVDAIIAGTRDLLVDYGLESQDTVDAWANAYKHYVPLHRERDGDNEASINMGIGQGYSVRGSASKRRAGSTRNVVDILANIALQRERAIVKGEKNNVARSLYSLSVLHPNAEFWTNDAPRVRTVTNGRVMDRIDPLWKSRENVIVARVPDKNGNVMERAVVLNEGNKRALRMAQAMKNLDTGSMDGLMGVSAKITRWFSAVNTQYNPIFGVVNMIRDTQSAMFNLSSTALAGKQAEVARHVLPALAGIYSELRAMRTGQRTRSAWAAEWEEFQNLGGATGYRDMHRTSADRGKAIAKSLRLFDAKQPQSLTGKDWRQLGRLLLDRTENGAAPVANWLSDYNQAMENAVRLAAFRAGKQQGMTPERAASLAKSLTVNFNRKGQIAQQAGALFAFFNASAQGTARMAEILFEMKDGKHDWKNVRLSKTGKKILSGAFTLGVLQAFALAAAGFDDDEPPQFVKERNLIIPIGGSDYITIPMPLGLNVLPNASRRMTEFVMGGFRDPHKAFADVFMPFIDTFNPIGTSSTITQSITPTPIRPIVDVAVNRDFSGRQIARPDFNSMAPTPGHTRARDTASFAGIWLSQFFNWATGGTDYTPGLFSPTPDQIDYLFGQATGGVGREIMKTVQTGQALATGSELPPYKVPLFGRFYGNTDGPAAERNRYYENIKKMNMHEAEIKGRQRAGEDWQSYMAAHPETRYVQWASTIDRNISKLRKQRKAAEARGASPEYLQQIDDRIAESMKRLNEKMRELKG